MDASQYPRTYQTSLLNRFLYTSLGTILAVAGLLGLWYFGTGRDKTLSPGGASFLAFFCFLFVLLGAYLAAYMLKAKVILSYDAIEIRELFTTKQVLRSQVAGWRIVATQYISTLELTPRDPQAKKIKFALTMKLDGPFHLWFATLPNLDRQEIDESKEKLYASRNLAETEEQHYERLAVAATIAKYLGWFTGAVSVWGWFYPRPYPLVILLLSALPLIAVFLGLRAKGVYQFEGRQNDAHPSLALPVILPGAVLTFRAVSDYSFLQWKPFLSPILLISFALTFLLSTADPAIQQRRWPILAMFVLALMYACGITAHADVLLDRSTPRVFHTEVLSKHVSEGRSTTWELHLGPWGPQAQPSDVTVRSSFYSSVQPGQTVCVNLFPGALKIAWFEVARCTNEPSASPVPPPTVRH
jgi:hypothetical protein